VQCWRKSRKLGVEPGQVPTCPHWASHEAVTNEHCTTNGEASV
jgi:hypothetical protein